MSWRRPAKDWRKKKNVPKSQRPVHFLSKPVPAMVDPMKTLGHPARGRKPRCR